MIDSSERAQLFHGGDLTSASKKSGIALESWLDLSTGISPYTYPTNTIPTEAFSRLPYIGQAFKDKTKGYYGSEHFVALPGTQVAIQSLPKLLSALPILLPSIGYQEHKHAWQKAGNPLHYYNALDEQAAFEEIENQLRIQPRQHILIINPNNPTALSFSPKQLNTWAKALAEDAYLIVDEAFIDTSPAQSLVPYLANEPRNNIIVLRSFGKFFGLAGIRLGFVFAAQEILQQFEDQVPLWSINGPALYLASKAFADRSWQTEHHERLTQSKRLTTELFEILKYEACFHQQLFSSYLLPKQLALKIFDHFYQQGILLRLIEVSAEKALLRVGRIRIEDTGAKKRIRLALQGIVGGQ
jgi:cobalamin biosynthetic protein CobC